MKSYVAFLRAVNVGKRQVAMARLREEFEGLGFAEVSTFINSGNVLFSTHDDPAGLEPVIEERLHDAFGFEIITFVRTAAAVRAIASEDPFGEAVGTRMVAFLRARPTATIKKAIEALSNDTDTFRVRGSEVRWLIGGSFMASSVKPAAFVKACGGSPNTARNTTMLKRLSAKLG